ncbi:hypothetical protein A3H10_05055 [Candidatus Uhrbacteria bacterium RIFCSPLOWO2_12_FULL_46_10]|uniref:Uncharacterized protein n=1 Tax=Candidatus Uhrbacteria bacterium RIFCSPLOWO2_01_FULL_47_25 TaxID=1802402 RepID=A0A1F7UZ72_9BACT|nr:MAG: hypothetical protein A2752_04395 [Candidatus Uhrbacteria bacterium RIFCSPHIGHO2_01_FULL_46_23]OGL70330.1 MAG: hypothetical protein A3D60_01910 [Candidatus Uhrbacteria bacterium RIFCSPHIGHO2_02_FULL_47_29]OGL83017.1 MAG: hypothetical protein A2936_03655 [Candidatus Uhrbacteria bacterium RIFCSPLOWO2_01_FULL_47_25]OGL84463.1 MAG: hypothetical protein A3I37_03645 [Candidatus Uhrbacteria bacterium RIFCSPLOWO2_02_FULL_46_19]OGL90629.1 MAG: hypothetical protein A3H10_05055 [Candidatus Uhrbacte
MRQQTAKVTRQKTKLAGKEADRTVRQVMNRMVKFVGWPKSRARRAARNWVKAINKGEVEFGS